jgi:hypothetical protein
MWDAAGDAVEAGVVLVLSGKVLEIAGARNEDHGEACKALLRGRHLRFEHGPRMRALLPDYDPGPYINEDSDLLGGMRAAVATVFVFPTARKDSWSAGVARKIATSVSFALCLLYLLVFPFTAAAALIGIGTLSQ